ncbi:DUF6798 domain-containing protein [Frigoriglobus tundricola]|uniref:DUF6798 domain-containing protein n=1 Tax=Frigoriglobus tundricola TaxID=2774151 RepID=A0A6M5YI66_9BACT|nr:DUF6798 domain-containing protein [Frigoriglobus tundricola]QJW93021.1 hypothetical protein FTUN_0521 [Frigoriglobus tundricola]
MSNPDSRPARRRHLLEALVLAAAFAVAHTQSPLYYSNQNQYWLHGAAIAGYGHLAGDWLATTRDPTPLFSALVAGAYATAGPWLLQPAYFALLVGYFLTARWLVAAVPGFPDTRPARIVFAALFTAAHAAILRWASVQLSGTDYPWYFQSGLAAQYLLGPGIQPSAFGVLLLVAVAAFAHGKPVTAAGLAALAVGCHGTYALPSALLTLGFMVALARAGRWRTVASIGAVALLVVSPAVIYNLYQFTAPPSTADEAAHILAAVRIPHHCAPARWFDATAGVQLAWCAIGLCLLRHTMVFVPLVVATAIGIVLTVVQIETGSDTLALMFPWRISVLLVPVATAVVVAKALACGPPGRRAERRAIVGLVALVAGGVAVTACGLGYRTADEHELYDYVRATAGPQDVYLLPVQFPGVGSGRGAVSNTFTRPPRAQPGANQIPVDLQPFRLATGARAYVDFKSVPYAPAEVLEWHRRMTIASEMTRRSDWTAPGRREELRTEGITHVVSPRAKPLAAEYLQEVHRDAAYVVYRVK